MNFREFILVNENDLSNLDIAGMYFNGEDAIRSLAYKTGKSIPEIYRIVHSFGKPNRRTPKHDVVRSLSDSGMTPATVANFTGYSKRHILNILKNGHNS